ncbi:tetratricopeptide repeat protein [Mesonia aestuariivivens]|uniref:Tetratricopeptide repeat protein n=1 Tax=Mesonia aestuariivivens TaxID=2796128 RepID=A0ABS6VXD7_9FLAO|nr:tetratricopeptide repeat protein [Mesonia aestuariivivens]MBW2960199.1 hypothetical protein [Mesonia aestuariivivens]
MKNKKLHTLIFFFGIFFGSITVSNSQEKQQDSLAIAKQEINQDNLGNIKDNFQEYFFQGLTQRGIENYEKAISALKKAQEIQPKNVAVFYELGKNYKALEQYSKAEENLYKALSEKEENVDILTELYDVFYLTQNYDKAIEIAKKLTPFNMDYYEDLANLYVRTQDYQKALEALDYINAKEGQSDYRDALREKIFSENPDKMLEENFLLAQLAEAPSVINNYLVLMHFYAKQNKLEKMYKIAEKLLNKYPEAKEAHYALYKKYLAEYKDNEAVASMKTVLESDLSMTMKKEVVKDFVQLVNQQPKYEQDLIESLDKQLANGESNADLAQFYKGRDNHKAIQNLEKVVSENPNDFASAKDLMLLYLQEEMPSKSILLAEEYMATYPSQPILYLVSGVANNSLRNFKEAEDYLLMGLDFLIDNPQMESDFYRQLAIAYSGLGKTEEADKFQQKFETIKKTL